MAETGMVKWFDGARGFGFIKPDQASTDLFMHVTQIKSAFPPAVSDRVEFERGEDKKGRAVARDVRILR